MSHSPIYLGTPRWVKTAGKLVAVLAILLVAALIFGGGNHGPWRHLAFEAHPTAATGSDPAPAGANPVQTKLSTGGN